MLNNIMHLALSEGQVNVARAFQQSIGYSEINEAEIAPFVRIVV